MLTTNISNPENRFPNCVRMELETKRINEAKFDLVANIRFGEHEISMKNRKAIFGVRKGKLKVEITNGIVPLANIKLNKEFQTVVEIKLNKEAGKELLSGVNVGLKNSGVSSGSKKTSKEAKEHIYKDYQVKTEGEEKDPCWVFEAQSYTEILEGLLKNTELATVNVKKKPCSLIATFEVENTEDIYLTNGSLLWQKNITKKKMAVIERSIVSRWIKELLKEKAYMSRQELVHG